MAGEREVRTQFEGELRWVQASGTGTWSTASAAATGLIGYVQAGMSFTKANNFVTISDRGIPKHHKNQGYPPTEVSFTVLHGMTAQYPMPATSSGVSTPQVHMELKQRVEEVATASGLFYQFHNGVIPSQAFSEAEAGDTLAFTVRFLNVSGFNSSGYLA
jgi:hypothetical protein